MQLINHRSYPRAIIHIDADSFFASCEQAVNPKLKGKPLITGRERGIASAVSVEAKRLGIKRGMSIHEIKEICPHIIYLPSDYETYSLFSKRMFEIVRRYTSEVEEYGIDECFAEITGLRRPLNMSYEAITASIKYTLDAELGMTFSVGLAPSKVLAKIGSKYNKPSGITFIPGRRIHEFLSGLATIDVWGIGVQTSAYLRQFGIETALQLARRDWDFVSKNLAKPYRKIWSELRGVPALAIETEYKRSYQSISKTKTFTPAVKGDRSFVLAQLSKNTENACIKLRRHKLLAKRAFFVLRTKDFSHRGLDIELNKATSHPHEIVSLIDEHFDQVFCDSVSYRATGVVLSDIVARSDEQLDLFGKVIEAGKVSRIYDQIDLLSERYGKHVVFLGSSFRAITGKQYTGARGESANRKAQLFKGEGKRKRVGMPMLGDVK